ncbi:MAG: hypothetical protein K5765_06810 [Clostridia bacterium]|nr:hypothetical protein [Clostridia bacterium]
MKYIDKMMDIIKEQFLTVMAKDHAFYSQYSIVLSNEQQYVKNKDRDPKKIYIVVKFISGSLNFGQNLVPININALGEGNKIEVCQRLLLEYAQEFNLGEPIDISREESGDGSAYIVKQTYTQPQVMSNFNESWNEFRSLFFMSGTFLLGKDSIPIVGIQYFESADDSEEKGTEIQFISSSWDFSIQLDSQGFYGTNSRTESRSKIGTLTVNIISYLVDNNLCNKILAIAFNDIDAVPNGIKEKFYLSIQLANGFSVTKMPFSLAHAHSPQNLGEFPLASLTFTN